MAAAAGKQRRPEEKEEEVVTEDDVGVGSTRDERNGTMVGEDGYVRGRMEGVERKQRR